jgi:hypothetical protein
MENVLIQWIENDKVLSSILSEIDEKGLSAAKSAYIAFSQVAEAYHLPQYPEDLNETIYREHEELNVEARSVFEELAILKYLSGPDDDIRGVTLNALYNVYNKLYLSVEEAALKYFGSYEKIPDTFMVYYFGDASNARIEFKIEQTNWTDSEARLMQKVNKSLYQ